MAPPHDPYRIEWSAPTKRSITGVPEKVAVAVIELVYDAPADNLQLVGRPLRWQLEGLHAAVVDD